MKIITVTSYTHGVGKTFITAHLAYFLQKKNYKVAIIEIDDRPSKIQNYYPISSDEIEEGITVPEGLRVEQISLLDSPKFTYVYLNIEDDRDFFGTRSNKFELVKRFIFHNRDSFDYVVSLANPIIQSFLSSISSHHVVYLVVNPPLLGEFINKHYDTFFQVISLEFKPIYVLINTIQEIEKAQLLVKDNILLFQPSFFETPSRYYRRAGGIPTISGIKEEEEVTYNSDIHITQDVQEIFFSLIGELDEMLGYDILIKFPDSPELKWMNPDDFARHLISKDMIYLFSKHYRDPTKNSFGGTTIREGEKKRRIVDPSLKAFRKLSQEAKKGLKADMTLIDNQLNKFITPIGLQKQETILDFNSLFEYDRDIPINIKANILEKIVNKTLDQKLLIYSKEFDGKKLFPVSQQELQSKLTYYWFYFRLQLTIKFENFENINAIADKILAEYPNDPVFGDHLKFMLKQNTYSNFDEINRLITLFTKYLDSVNKVKVNLLLIMIHQLANNNHLSTSTDLSSNGDFVFPDKKNQLINRFNYYFGHLHLQLAIKFELLDEYLDFQRIYQKESNYKIAFKFIMDAWREDKIKPQILHKADIYNFHDVVDYFTYHFSKLSEDPESFNCKIYAEIEVVQLNYTKLDYDQIDVSLYLFQNMIQVFQHNDYLETMLNSKQFNNAMAKLEDQMSTKYKKIMKRHGLSKDFPL